MKHGLNRPPKDWWRWRLDGQDLGWLAPAHQQLLAGWGLGEPLPDAGPLALPEATRETSSGVSTPQAREDARGAPSGARTWAVHSGAVDADGRSRWLENLALRLRECGWVRGWRHERYRCQLPGPGDEDRPAGGAVFFELERAAYRFFGLTSQAVHVNGVDESGALWCGRRSPRKATDPGRLDNLAAGGLPAGEELWDCARRELWEEAGVPAALCGPLRLMGSLRTARVEPEGWHEEWLHVFELVLPAGFTPRNQDGEVSAFECLAPAEVAQRMHSQDFSPDAAAVSDFWLRTRAGDRPISTTVGSR